MANEIYNTSWWGTALDTARTAGTNPDFFGSQFKLLTSEQDNLVVNGDFATDLSGWTLSPSATATWVNGRAFITTTQNYKGLYQYISGLNVGSKYLMKYSTELDTAVEVRMYVNPPSTNLIKNYNGDFELTFIATNTNVRVEIQVANSTGSAYFDNVSLQLVRAELDQIEAKKCLADWIHTTALKDLNN